MSPITHLLASWTLADISGLRRRDATLATWCGVLPDADGLGVLIDGANHLLGRPDNWFYGRFHHLLLHGLFAGIAIPLALCLLRRIACARSSSVSRRCTFICCATSSVPAGRESTTSGRSRTLRRSPKS